MSSVKEHLCKLREERLAREKARIEKLRELNLKKYSKTELPLATAKSIPVNTAPKVDVKKTSSTLKNNFHVNNTTKRPITVPVLNNRKSIAVNNNVNTLPNNHKNAIKNNVKSNIPLKKDSKVENKTSHHEKIAITHNNTRNSIFKMEKTSEQSVTVNDSNKNAVTGFALVKNVKKDFIKSNKNIPRKSISQISVRKSIAPSFGTTKPSMKPSDTRKSFQPTKMSQSATKIDTRRQSVFERLYQPKHAQKPTSVTDSEKLKSDPTFLNKVIKNSGLILSRGDFLDKKRVCRVRRSISAVHFKHISKHEVNNCVHKWSSIGEKLDKAHLKDIDEDVAVKEDKIVSAVKSERKKVKFQTPISNFNTPRPEELQAKLHSWLQKRGKSIDSFQHLQCFGIHHLPNEIKPLNLSMDKCEELKPLSVDSEYFEDCLEDEDKENKPLESDSDDESYEEMMNNKPQEEKEVCAVNIDEATEWRHASIISDSVADLNETQDTTLTPMDTISVDDLAIGAINDLTQLLREGYSWEQCARWLRAIRERVPTAPRAAPYWECRAELEARRGDLPASVHCWEQACAQGTEPLVVEANLDQLLDKFMQLKISPSSGQEKLPDPKLVDVKNVFKSTLIRFAVQQAKIRRSQELKLIVTPVRRSGRLSAAWSGKKTFRPPLVEFSSARKCPRTPLAECTTLREAEELHPTTTFVPNEKLCETP